jgi:hypothetical protein
MRAKGFPLEVALIATPVDLGGVPDYFGDPQNYAEFLNQEISPTTRQPLLVVMPDAFGLAEVPQDATGALDAVAPPGDEPTQFASVAISAAYALAKAAGYEVPVPQHATLPSEGSSSGGSGALKFALPGVLIVIVIAVGVIRDRRRSSSEPETEADP